MVYDNDDCSCCRLACYCGLPRMLVGLVAADAFRILMICQEMALVRSWEWRGVGGESRE